MSIIYKSENFTVESADKPHITRSEGGHIRIIPKKRIADRTALTPRQAIEFIRLTMIAGEAMSTALNKRGIDVGRINYQDMGNWSVFAPDGPYFHVHLYGRAKSAKIQKFGDAVYLPQRKTGFYDKNEALKEGDIKEIRREIKSLFMEEKYKDKYWKI